MMKFIVMLTLAVSTLNFAWAKKTALIYMGRNFILVTPNNSSKAPKPLLVLLHGCKQNPDLMIEGTKIEEAAIKNNFMVLAPEQPSFANFDHCWNWFLDFNQMRAFGNEMGQIIGAIDVVGNTFAIDKNRVFVAGISAGGVMAHNLTACYPDVFKGAAIHSGLNFKIAESMNEAQTVITSYEQKTPSYLGKKMFECSRKVESNKLDRVVLIHGAQDSRVPPLHTDLISEAQAVWRDYLDDGSQNSSVRGRVSKATLNFPMNYQIEKTDTVFPGFTERKLLVKGMGHAWGGGRPVSVNFDPSAPSSTQIILEFFSLSK